MEFKLGTANIMELGNLISDKLKEYGIFGKSYKPTLSITLDKDKFYKVDEDLYYRINEQTSEKDEYIPSDGEIIIGFDNLEIKIKNGTST